jgi:hypothetical protein
LLARLVGERAGRAGEPRIKLALTLLWLSREDVEWAVENVPAATMATLFGLEDPETLGAERVRSAIRWLNEAEIIRAEIRQGRSPRLAARHESGNKPWTSPVGQSGRKIADDDRYAQLDKSFWANGWIAVLSARAIAALVILLDATWGRKGAKKQPKTIEAEKTIGVTYELGWFHVTEDQLRNQYGISRDLFDRGIKELAGWGLVEQRLRGMYTRTTWGEKQRYRELRVRLDVLRSPIPTQAP